MVLIANASRSESSRRFVEARACCYRMRGKKVRALQWRARAAAVRSRLPRNQCKKLAEPESSHLDSGAFDCSFAVERLIAGVRQEIQIQKSGCGIRSYRRRVGTFARPRDYRSPRTQRPDSRASRDRGSSAAALRQDDRDRQLRPDFGSALPGSVPSPLRNLPGSRRRRNRLPLRQQRSTFRSERGANLARDHDGREKPGSSRRILFAVLVGAVVLMLADFAWRRFEEHEAPPAPVESPAAMASSAEAPNETLPPAAADESRSSSAAVVGVRRIESSASGDRSTRDESYGPAALRSAFSRLMTVRPPLQKGEGPGAR